MRITHNQAAEMSVQFPNATHFAFNPAIIEVTSTAMPTTPVAVTALVTVAIKGGEYTEQREFTNANGASCIFDIRRYLQLAFARTNFSRLSYGADIFASPLTESVRVSLSVVIDGTTYPLLTNETISALWGAIDARESTGGTMRRKWFVGYPFTLDIFAQQGEAFDVSSDRELAKIVFYPQGTAPTGPDNFRRCLLDVGRVFEPDPTTRSLLVVMPHTLIIKNGVQGIGLAEYIIDIERCAKGVYVRWIDRQGRYCYYLLRDLGAAASVTSAGSWEHNDMTAADRYIDNVNIGTPTRQQLRLRTTRSLGARLVDADTFALLLTLAASPVVDVFDGYDPTGAPLWHRVNIVASNYEESKRHLQDFTLTIEEPAKDSQIL